MKTAFCLWPNAPGRMQTDIIGSFLIGFGFSLFFMGLWYRLTRRRQTAGAEGNGVHDPDAPEGEGPIDRLSRALVKKLAYEMAFDHLHRKRSEGARLPDDVFYTWSAKLARLTRSEITLFAQDEQALDQFLESDAK